MQQNMNSADPEQTVPNGAVWSWLAQFAERYISLFLYSSTISVISDFLKFLHSDIYPIWNDDGMNLKYFLRLSQTYIGWTIKSN